MSLPTSLTLAEAATKTGSLQCGGSCVLSTVVLLLRNCVNLLLIPSVGALSSAKSVCDYWEFYFNSGVGF